VEDAADQLLAELCADLKRLWTQAGGPSLRRLEGQLRISKSQLGAILNGRIRRPPDWRVVSGLVRAATQYAADHGQLDRVSLRTGVAEFWRPRYAVLEHAFSRPGDVRSGPPGPARDSRAPLPELPPPGLLPTAVAGFTGRGEATRTLDGLLPAEGRPEPAARIALICGTAGVGKTALAVHWGHRVRDRFPDGQLYVNLRGFDPADEPLEPATALRLFFDAFGVPAARVPPGIEAQAGLLRSLLAGKRVLVVLDNAHDADQVRPLLPGAPGCQVVVTSRNQLASLVTAEGALPLTLDLLSHEESRQLLAARVGAARVVADRQAADEIVACCARLPLALAIVAARAATHPRFRLGDFAAELGGARLDALAGTDPAADVRAVFSWSYHAVTPDAARLFRLLGLHPGPDVSAPAAASLAGIAPSEVLPLLNELTRANLINEHVPGRYGFHDLLRAYAAEQAHAIDSDEVRHESRHLLFDHYLYSASSAALGLAPSREHITLATARPGVTPETPGDHDAALAWFAAEHPVLVSIVTRATPEWDVHAWQLAWALMPFLDRQGHWHELTAMLVAALAAAQRLDDRAAQAYVHRSLGVAYARQSQLDLVRVHTGHAVELFAEVGDLVGEAHTWLGVAWLSYRLDDAAQGDRDTRRALELYRAAGHRVGEARALGNLGWAHAHRGEYEQALARCQQALAVHQQTGDREGEATAWDSLGYAYHRCGDNRQAVTCYEHAAGLRHLLGDRYAHAETLHRLGDTHLAAADPASARTAWQQALAILDQLAHSDAVEVRAKLGALQS
jgi:tetratricopeptide (TPR) repeat protein